MSSDALALVAVVGFLVAVLAVVFVPILIYEKKNKNKNKRRSGGSTSISNDMNDIINVN